MEEDIIISSTEIIKDKLYFATLETGYKPKPTKNSKYFHIEDDIVYENFYFDFGPYHLCHLYQFCKRLNAELQRNQKKKVVFYTSNNEMLRLNAAYLIGSYQIIYLDQSPGAVYKQLTEGSEWLLLNFRDASGGPSLFDITLLDVLHGVKVAYDSGFFNFDHFDAEQYLFYEKVENGDLNWVIPGKMLAFSGPHHRSRLDHGYPLHSPEHYHTYFRRHNVTTIVRLNKKSYDARQFTAHGFEHRDLFFVDGSVPSDLIVNRFIRIAEAAKGAVAVHCKAGLGRTGTLIACYMMKHHGFRAREAISWLRICRPGSVIGHQQWFLENIQSRMHAEGDAYRRRQNISSLPVFKRGIYSDLPPEPPKLEDKPISLQTILNCDSERQDKLDNDNILNANVTDFQNNVTTVISKVKSIPATAVPQTIFMRKTNYSIVTNNTKIPNNSLKLQPRIASLKSHYASKTSTFPPTRNVNQAKTVGFKSPFACKSSLQRANLARPTLGHAHTGGSLKSRKCLCKFTSSQDANLVTTISNVTTTLSALTENCHLNSKSRLSSVPTLNSTNKQNIGTSKKKCINSKLRKKTSKGFGSNQDLSSSDTNITNMSADSLEVQYKSASPEPMDLANSIITTDVTPENYQETSNSQGNKLYKIKALRKKCSVLSANAPKKEGIQTRSCTSACAAAAKKK